MTRIEFGSPPDRIDRRRRHRRPRCSAIHLGPYQTKLVGLSDRPDQVEERPRPASADFDHAVHELRRSYEEWERESTQIVTDNELFNQLLDRSLRDLRALYTHDGRRARCSPPASRGTSRCSAATR